MTRRALTSGSIYLYFHPIIFLLLGHIIISYFGRPAPHLLSAFQCFYLCISRFLQQLLLLYPDPILWAKGNKKRKTHLQDKETCNNNKH